MQGCRLIETVNGGQEATISLPRTRWPTYRGVRSDGTADTTAILDRWPEEGPKEVYRRAIGGGYAGFVIDKGRAYTIEQRGEQEVVAAYALATGEEA